MLPLRDTVRSRSIPFVTYALIGLNVLAFLYEVSLGQQGFARFLTTYGLIPARLSWAEPWSYFRILTSMFLHGSWFHVISNMWVLFIFGDNVEDRMGPSRYLVFYLLVGSVAGLTQAYFVSNSQLPTVGASGAIAGVLGAYLVLYPQGRVLTLIPLFIIPWFVEIPAFIYLGFWFFSQLSSGLMSLGQLGAGNVGGIAWWAHVGGFMAGLVLVRAFVRHQRRSWPTGFDL